MMKNVSLILLVALAATLSSCGSSSSVAAADDGEQVNVGYGSTSRDKLTYSVSSVTPEQEIDVYSNMYDYLRGRVAGLDIGPENSMSSVHIRGVNSINASTDPLILMDGQEIHDTSSINPDEIHSVDVIKDGSAASYGMRGGNGVILITSKAAYHAKQAEQEARKREQEARKAARKAAKEAKKK